MKKPEDIHKLDKEIRKFKEKRRSERRESSGGEEYSHGAVGFQISTELLAGVLIGAGIGYILDKFFNSKPWLIAMFTILGGAAGILSIYKTFRVGEKTKE